MPEVVRRSLPNSLTMLRLALAGVFFGTLNVYRFDAEAQHAVWANVAVGVFILAVITDILDGYLARRWQVVSVFGRIMDPFCDKVLILGGFIYLAGPRFAVSEWAETGDFITMATGVYPWMVVVMLARERYRAIDPESADAQVQKEAIIVEVMETVNADYERALRGDTDDRFEYKWNYDLTSNPEAIRRALEAPREIEPPELEQMKGEGTPVRRRRG